MVMRSTEPNLHATLALRAAPTGVILPVHAQPGSRRQGITGIHDGRLKLAVTQVAEKGKANKEFIKLLAQLLGVSKSAVELRQGETSHLKEFHITGLGVEQVGDRLRPLLEAPNASRPGS
jgi:hypothetical protein